MGSKLSGATCDRRSALLCLLSREGPRVACSIEVSALLARCCDAAVASERCSHVRKMLRMASKKAGAAAVACAGLAGCRA